MKKVRVHLLFLLALTLVAGLMADIASMAQEQTAPADQEKQAAAKAEKDKKRAVDRAAAPKKRAAVRMEHEQKRAAAKVKHAAARKAAEAKRAVKRTEAREKRLAAEAKRAVKDALRKAIPPDGTFKLLGARPNFNTSVIVTGAPYSATAVTERIQTLSDGNQIIQKNEAAYYRDRDGRMRVDQTLKTIGKWTAAGEPPRIITIWDPVAGYYYSLNPQTQTALKNSAGSPRKRITPVDQKSSTITAPSPDSGTTISPPGEKSKLVKSATGSANTDRKQIELLGRKQIEGVSAEGTRTIRTIPAGEIGNLQPIRIVDEHWYSPELQMQLLTTHHDPRTGNTTYRLTNISRSDPNPSLFEIPTGYRLLDKTKPTRPPLEKLNPESKPTKKTEVIL